MFPKADTNNFFPKADLTFPSTNLGSNSQANLPVQNASWQPIIPNAPTQDVIGKSTPSGAMGIFPTGIKTLDLTKPIEVDNVKPSAAPTIIDNSPQAIANAKLALDKYRAQVSGAVTSAGITNPDGSMKETPPPPPPAPTTETRSFKDILSGYMGGIGIKEPVQVDRQKIMEDAKVAENAKILRDYQSQLAGINAEAQSAALTQQGRLTDVGAISGAQADIERKRAIRAIPLSAAIASAQGNYDAAVSQANIAIDDAKDYQKQVNDYRLQQLEMAKTFATADQQMLIEKEKQKILNQTNETNDVSIIQKQLIAQAKDQPALVKALTEVNPSDPKARALLGAIASQIKPEVKNTINEMTPGQVSNFNALVNAKNKSPLLAASDRTPVLTASIKEARANPTNGANQLNLVYSYVQALDTYQSAVREGELSLVQSIDSKIGQLSNSVQQITSGQIVRADVIKNMADAAEKIVNTINNAAREKAKSYEAQANVIGLGSQWKQYNAGFTPTYNAPTSEEQQLLDLGYTQEQIDQIKNAK